MTVSDGTLTQGATIQSPMCEDLSDKMMLDSAIPSVPIPELEGTRGGEQMSLAIEVDVTTKVCLPNEVLVEVGVQTAEEEPNDTFIDDLQTYIDRVCFAVWHEEVARERATVATERSWEEMTT